MGVSYEVVYVKKPVTEGQVQEVLNQIDADLAKLERVEESYSRHGLSAEKDSQYQRLADRLRNNYELAEQLAAQFEAAAQLEAFDED